MTKICSYCLNAERLPETPGTLPGSHLNYDCPVCQENRIATSETSFSSDAEEVEESEPDVDEIFSIEEELELDVDFDDDNNEEEEEEYEDNSEF